MNKDKFKSVVNMTFNRIKLLTDTKGEEYSRSDDQLANFKRGAIEAGASEFVVWLIFFNKHIDSIKSFVRTGGVKSEPIEHRIDDAILYLILLKALIEEKSGSNHG